MKNHAEVKQTSMAEKKRERRHDVICDHWLKPENRISHRIKIARMCPWKLAGLG